MAWTKSWRGPDGRLRWYVVFRDGEGKERSRPLGCVDEEEARQEAADQTRREEGREPRQRTTGARTALAHFLLSLRVARRSRETIRFYRKMLTPLVEEWRATPTRRWSATMLSRYVGGRKWSPRTTQMLVMACHRWIKWADLNRAGIPDFLRGFDRPRVRAVEKAALTESQLRAVCLAARAHKYDLPVHLAIYAGLAWGDLKALQWSEVNLESGWLQRRRCKTDELIRVPIAAPLAEALKRHRATHGAVCRSLPKSGSSSLRTLRGIMERAGIDVDALEPGNRGWHLFRHSYATLIGDKTRDLSTVRDLLGHKPGSPVTARYVHSSDDRKVAAIQQVTRAIGRAKAR